MSRKTRRNSGSSPSSLERLGIRSLNDAKGKSDHKYFKRRTFGAKERNETIVKKKTSEENNSGKVHLHNALDPID